MRIDVAFGPLGLTAAELSGRTVMVIDVLRATTTICAALDAGARAIIPVASMEEALRMAQTLDSRDVVLAGERHCDPIPGFPLGNSPRQMTPEAVGGRTIVMTTTNGTGALLAVAPAAAVFVAAAVNLAAAGAQARRALADQADLLVVCAGREQAFSLDDAYTAGRLILEALGGRRARKGLNDGAIMAVDLARKYGPRFDRPLGVSAAGRQLRAQGYAEDIAHAASVNRHPVLPQFRERRITRVADQGQAAPSAAAGVRAGGGSTR